MASRDNPDFLSAKSLMNDKVINTEGEELGKFDDLMIDLEEEKIAYAALSFGGTLGMGNKLFAIPWKALTLRVHEHAFVLDIPKEVLKKAEGFDKDNWPATSRESLSKMYNHYGYQPYWERETGEDIQLPGHAAPEPTAQTGTSAGRASGFLRASKIQGEKVFNRDGDHIGKIEDIMIDLQDGRIAYAVISHGGILGLGSKHIPIPWQALSLRSRDNAFVIDLPKEALDKAEGLDKDKWPVTREELSRTFSYYKYQPYWQTGAAAGLAGATAASAMREREVMPETTETETTTRMEPEREVQKETVAEETVIEETVIEEAVIEEAVIEEPVRTEETSQARLERERLEALKAEEERKLSELERQKMEAAARAETQRECLDRLERERIEAERQARIERERLAQLERELEEARRREETEKVTRLEEELKAVRLQEETHRERLAQLEKERMEVERQTETEKEQLTGLERERMERESQAQAERERLARLEEERRMEVQPAVAAMGTMIEREVPEFLSAGTIKSDRVVNSAGEDLGRIEELMIDLENYRVAYAVLSFGGFLGMADRLFAIPMQALKLRPHEHAFTLDIPKEVLEGAEGFDKDHWPLTREELSRSYTYFGYQPYWQTMGMGQAEIPAGMSRETERVTEPRKSIVKEKEKESRLKTAEELIAEQEKERLEQMESKETDQEKIESLEREKQIAERREHKYDVKKV